MARLPLYKAAETEMIRRIREGDWAVGLRLPNEFGLADEFGVSQGTMRRALITLEGMGLLARKPGRGTIVTDPPAAAVSEPSITGFERLSGADGTPIEMEVFRARASVRGADPEAVALFDTERLCVLERTLKHDGDRFALEEIAVPETVIPALDENGPADLIALLGAAGVSVARIDDRIGADMTSMADSVALSVDRHTALLGLTRVARDASGQPVARQVLRVVAKGVGYGVTLSA